MTRLVGSTPMTDALEFALDVRWPDVPRCIRRHVGMLVLDFAAVCAAGRLAPAARTAADYAAEAFRGDEAVALLDGRRLSTAGAAWANGVLGNVLDYDDGHRITKGHPGAIVIPSALAAGEAVGAPPEEVLAAILGGYEVAIRAGVLLHGRTREYHASGAWGSIGAAIAAGRLIGLDVDGLRHAVGLAEYHAPIALMTRSVADPAMTKDATGWGALIGTTSAGLARRGYTALRSEFLEHHDCQGIGHEWKVNEVYVKPYPCCRWSHPALDAATSLKAHECPPNNIMGVKVRTFEAAARLSRRRPKTTEEMQYSLVWPLAAILARGTYDVPGALGGFDDPDVVRLRERVSVVVDAELTSRFPGERLAEVTVTLDDGRSFASAVTDARGEPGAESWLQVVEAKADMYLGSSAFAKEPPRSSELSSVQESNSTLMALSAKALEP
jgi:2-methylcitrate dehydratase PrpD